VRFIMEKSPLILVLDEAPDVLAAFDKALSKFHTVHQASCLKDALNILDRHNVDFILSDQAIPGRSLVNGMKNSATAQGGQVMLTHPPDLDMWMDDILSPNPLSADQSPENRSNNAVFLMRIAMIAINIRLQQAVAYRDTIEAQLEQTAQRATLGELTAGIVHEISNPLGFISSNLSNLNKFVQRMFQLLTCYDTADMTSDSREHIVREKDTINFEHLATRIPQIIERSIHGANRMATILKDLKLSAGKSGDGFAPADIHGAMDSTLNIITNEVKNRVIITKNYGAIPLINCNIAKLQQVFLNILINAGHAIKDNGTIGITTFIKDGMVVIEISDNGAGIPETAAPHIFDSFFTTKPRGKGTGLGLAISKTIIDNHNGHIGFKSTPGQGTTFFITLPVNQAT